MVDRGWESDPDEHHADEKFVVSQGHSIDGSTKKHLFLNGFFRLLCCYTNLVTCRIIIPVAEAEIKWRLPS